MPRPQYESISESDVPRKVRFDVPRQNQGQGTAGEVAYGGLDRAEHCPGDPYMRVRTAAQAIRSSGGTYYRLARPLPQHRALWAAVPSAVTQS